MKTAEAIKDIECIVVGQKSLTQEQRNQIKTVLESYRKQHAIKLLKYEHNKEGLDTTHIKYDKIHTEFLNNK